MTYKHTFHLKPKNSTQKYEWKIDHPLTASPEDFF